LIVTLTLNPVVDKSSSIDHVIPERKLRCDVPSFEPGGGGINVSRVVHRLGGRTRAIYPAGGPVGELLKGSLDREGIDHDVIPIRDMTRENLIVYERSSGLQYRFGMPGPELTAEECDACVRCVRELPKETSFLVASGSLPRGMPQDFYARLAKAAHERGVRLVVDTSGEPLRLAAQEGVFLLKPNLRELSLLTGKDEISAEDEQEIEARGLIRDGATEAVVVSLGQAGVLLVTAKETCRIAAPTVPIKSKVGAGDSMVGAITYALAQGKDMTHAVMYGVAAGAAAVMTPGTELCRRQDVEMLYERVKRRAG
jgi:6-phosphofructokinase 2